MAFNPNEISKEHVLKAIEFIESRGILLISSHRWDVVINGKPYPPKEIMRYAHQQMNGEKIWDVTGGEPTNIYLKKLGFEIIEKNNQGDPVQVMIGRYKDHLDSNQLKDEIYKWELLESYKGRPDINASNFLEELKGIKYQNLIYPMGIGVMNHIARERPEPYLDCFKALFNESLPLLERLDAFNKRTLTIYRELNPDKPHHHDERTMATILAFHSPDKYPLYKDSFYQQYCSLIGVQPKEKGKKYQHYIELLDGLIGDYIEPDAELIEQYRKLIPAGFYQDSNYKLLAQDILYQTLDKHVGVSRAYWRIGTTDNDKSYWDEMKRDKVVAIGWPNMGDLSVYEPGNKGIIMALLEKGGYFSDDNQMKSRKAGEIFSFYSDAKLNDVILAQDGDQILGIGILKGDYFFDESKGFPHRRGVEWKVFSPGVSSSKGRNTTFYQISDMTLVNEIEHFLQKKGEGLVNPPNKLFKMPLNQILFGPPGTGKTYQSKSLAVEILDGSLPETRKEVNKRYGELFEEGRIQFVTFHQSTSYEDIIEGIKPVMEEVEEEEDRLQYKKEDGIFKQICVQAAYEFLKDSDKALASSKTLTFSQLFDKLLNEYQQKRDEGLKIEIPLKSGNNTIIVKEISSQGNFILQHKDGQLLYTVSKSRLEKLFNEIEDFDSIPNIYSYFRSIIGGSNASAYWAILNQINKLNQQPKSIEVKKVSYEDKLKAFERINWNEIDVQKNVPRYLLIIDEINRGNIAAIFGELITLLEEDKRGGNGESLKVTLPYSKSKFSVPPNLYVVGTMNTADRSVEALDTALRRRFVFKEIPPEPEFVSPKGLIRLLCEKLTDHQWDTPAFREPADALYEFLGTTREAVTAPNYEQGAKIGQTWALEDIAHLDKVKFPGVRPDLLLGTMNDRIEKLLDKDHRIGHSYFMSLAGSLDPVAELKHIFQHKILPLLQEYFYGDLGRISLIIGPGFFKEDGNNIQFMEVDWYGPEELSERRVVRFNNITEMKNEAFIQLIKAIYGKSTQS